MITSETKVPLGQLSVNLQPKRRATNYINLGMYINQPGDSGKIRKYSFDINAAFEY